MRIFKAKLDFEKINNCKGANLFQNTLVTLNKVVKQIDNHYRTERN